MYILTKTNADAAAESEHIDRHAFDLDVAGLRDQNRHDFKQ